MFLSIAQRVALGAWIVGVVALPTPAGAQTGWATLTDQTFFIASGHRKAVWGMGSSRWWPAGRTVILSNVWPTFLSHDGLAFSDDPMACYRCDAFSTVGSGDCSGIAQIDENRVLIVASGWDSVRNAYLRSDYIYDGCSLTLHARSTNQGPSCRYEFGLVTNDDPVLFGGAAAPGGALLNDTWLWRNGTWTLFQSASSPPPRKGHTMVKVHNGLLLFGGEGATGRLDDLWILQSAGWRQLSANGTAPPGPRSGCAMAPLGEGALLFGGIDQAGAYRSDVFALTLNLSNGTATWSALTTTGQQPSGRAFSALLPNYRLIGGLTSPTTPSSEVYRFRYDTRTWTLEHPATAGPVLSIPLQLPVAAATERQVFVFSGITGGNTLSTDLWSYDGAGWARDQRSGPLGRIGAAAVAVADAFPPADRMFLLGGVSATSYSGSPLDDAWTYEPNSGWTRLTWSFRPPARWGGKMVVALDRVYLFGGETAGGQLYADLWSIDLPGFSTWRWHAPPGPWPAARRDPVMVFDEARSRIVVHGGNGGSRGYLDDTWELPVSGSGVGSWVPGVPSGIPREFAAACYSPVLRGMLVRGGHTGGPVQPIATDQVYDGSGWRVVGTAYRGPARTNAQLVYMPGSEGHLHIGGWSPQSGVAPVFVDFFSSPCTSCYGYPNWGWPLTNDRARPGASMTFYARQPRPLYAWILGFSNVAALGLPLPLPLPMFPATGRVLLTSPDVVLLDDDRFTLVLPNDSGLAGLSFYLQTLDASVPELTGAIAVRVGV